MAAAASVAVGRGGGRGGWFFERRKKEGREELSVCGSQRRAVLVVILLFFFFSPFFFHLYRKNWPDPCVSLPHPLFTLCFRRYIRRWKEQCDLIVPFHFISDTIASVIFIESCVRAYVCMYMYHLSLCREMEFIGNRYRLFCYELSDVRLAIVRYDIWLRIFFFFFCLVNPCQ